MKTFGRDDVLAFLVEVDELLTEPVGMEIIGGAAALLAYGATSATKDIDSFENIDERISRVALLTARKIPLDRAAVADPPYNYEDRRQRLNLPLRNLTVWVPERHDLLLMKAVRAARHDEEVIQEMHEAEPFDLEIIVKRYNEEMGQIIGDHRILDQKLQLIVEKLFGPKSARRIGKAKKH